MEIQKVKNSEKTYDLWLKNNNKELKIMFGGNLDLYLSLSNGDFISENKNTCIDFDITKENYQIYSAFDEMYNNIINGTPFGKKTDYDKMNSFIDRFEYHKLVDKNKDIIWVSDDGPEEVEDRFKFSKIDEDTYRLFFYRNDKEPEIGFKSNTSIVVRVRNSGSRYGYFNCPFMIMFNKLQELDPVYHQIHFEEIAYQKKLEKKRNSTFC